MMKFETSLIYPNKYQQTFGFYSFRMDKTMIMYFQEFGFNPSKNGPNSI